MNPIRITWACIGHRPTMFAFGTLEGLTLSKIKAEAVRQKNGSWNWQAFPWKFAKTGQLCFGNEPSRELAQKAAETFLKLSSK